MHKNTLVSVCIITYNHENFIREAINSVLQQKTEFGFEIIIADDCSIDNTRQIIKEYVSQHPFLFKLVFQEKNVGPGNNFIDLLAAAQSKYIAYFEGDDYWTDTGKLQKQIDFLEKNPDYALTFHNVDVVTSDNKFIEKIYPADRKTIIGFEDLVKGDYTKTCACIFRNDKQKLSPLFDRRITPDDTSLYLAVLDGSKGYYFNDTMAAYRVHGGGVWSTKKRIYQLENSFNFFSKSIAFYKKYPEVVFFKRHLNAVYADLATEYFLQRNYRKGGYYFLKTFTTFKWANTKIYWNFCKTCIRSILPFKTKYA